MDNWIKNGLIELLRRGEIKLFNSIVKDLRNLNLIDANLSYANLSDANLSYANLSDANLIDANLINANLSDANLSYANLSDANLSYANLSDANLSYANLSYANLIDANLKHANLIGANLIDANLIDANLSYANLSDANLSYANLSDANLNNANLSKIWQLKSPSFWLAENFGKDEKGYIVYKAFGNTYKQQPWIPEPGKIICETVNFDRAVDCACGVNFATLKWIEAQGFYGSELWRCRIRWEWLADVCVPYHSDGKARCQILECLKKVKK